MPRDAWNASRHAPGSANREAAATRHLQLRGGESVSGQEYLPQYNRRFARPPAQPEDYHGRKPSTRELREIFRLETMRSISNDWVIRHAGRWLQLNRASDTTDRPRARRWSVSTTTDEWKCTTGTSASGFVNCRSRCAPRPSRCRRREKSRCGKKPNSTIPGAWVIRTCGHGLGLRRYRPRPLFCALFHFALTAALRSRAQNNGMTFTKKGYF